MEKNEVELLMIMAFKLIDAKIVFTIHNVRPRHGEMKWYHSILYRIMYLLCNHLIIHSHSGKDEVVKLFALDPDKISVIPHGDYKFFVPERSLTKNQAKAVLGTDSTLKKPSQHAEKSKPDLQ